MIKQAEEKDRARIQYIEPYVSDYRAQIGLYLGYIPNTYADTVSSENFYEVLKNDPAVFHAMHLLSIMAAGEYVEVVSKKFMLKKIYDLALSYLNDFTHSRKSLVYGSVLFGMALQKKTWKKVRLSEFPNMIWELPDRLIEIDRRLLMIERDVNDRNKCYWTIYDPSVDCRVILFDKSETKEGTNFVQDYIWYFHEYEGLNPYGRGLGDALYQICHIKSKVVEYWADLCESWAKPFMIATVDAARAAIDAASTLGNGFVDATKRANDLLDAFEKSRARHMVVLDQSDKVDFHEAGSTGNNILYDFLNYADQKIQLLILGAELTTSAPSVGSYALGQIHRGATQSIIQYNRLRLEETLERDLIQCIYLKNKQNFLDLGVRLRPGDLKLKVRVESEEKLKRNPEKEGK